MKKKVLIIGGSGFIGLNLIKLLLKKNDELINIIGKKKPNPLTIGKWNFEVFSLETHFPNKLLKYLGINFIDNKVIQKDINDNIKIP